jgi:lipoprotein
MKSLRILFTLFLVSLAACSKQTVTEQSVSQESEPSLVLKSYATVFGATVEGDHTVVGLYDVYKTQHGHRRLLAFSCGTKTGKPRIYDTNTYFVFGRKVENQQRVAITDIQIGDNHYPTDQESLFKETVNALYNAKRIIITTDKGDSFSLLVDNLESDYRPCSE